MTDWFLAHLVLIEGMFVTFLVALSIQVPIRFGVFSFAGVAAFGLGAYGTGVAWLRWGLPTVGAIAVGVLLAVVVSLLVALVVYRLHGLYLAMATIAVTLTVGIVAVNGGSTTGGAVGLYGVFGNLALWHVVVTTVGLCVLLQLSERGRLGRRIATVRDDPELAGSIGIPVGRYRIAAFLASGLLGGVAGAFEIMVRSAVAPNNIGFKLVVLALTVVIIGGVRSWKGVAIGAVLVTWLPELLAGAARWQHIVYGVLVVLAAVFVPGGIIGLVDAVRPRRPVPS